MKVSNVIGGTIVGAAFLAAGAAASIPAYKDVKTSCANFDFGATTTLSDGSVIGAPSGGCGYDIVKRVADGNLLHKTIRDVGKLVFNRADLGL